MLVATVYPGADAKVLADTVASPIEQEVNGVAGHALHVLHLFQRRIVQADGDLRGRHRPGRSRRCWCRTGWPWRMPRLPQEVQRQGVTAKKQSTNIIMAVLVDLPTDDRYDDLYPEQLRLAPDQGRAEPNLRRRRRHGHRQQQLRDADLARPREAQGP